MLRPRSLLPLIVAFKVVKVVLLTAVGVTLLRSVHRDSLTVLRTTARLLHARAGSPLFERAVHLVAGLTVRRQVALACVAFSYAGVMAIEAIGLHRRRPWARWLTIGVTASFIPLEVYEMLRAPHLGRALVFIANLAIVGYLILRKDEFS